MSTFEWALGQPDVADALAGARDACTKLRWHNALRRRHEECRLEAQLRAAQASASLEGVQLPLSAVRDIARGATAPGDDVSNRMVMAALRVQAQIPRLAGSGASVVRTSLPQALASLHLAAASGLVDDEQIGRPRHNTPRLDHNEPRLSALAGLLANSDHEPAPIVAAVLLAEVESLGLFPGFDGLVARALGRAWLIGTGVDPTGVAIPEVTWADNHASYASALTDYADGSRAGVARWLVTFCEGVASGAAQGESVCNAVLVGRLN